MEPDEVDAPGYDLAFWSHRIRLLGLANALGPCPSLKVLELLIHATQLGVYRDLPSSKRSWGIVQLRDARWQAGHGNVVALARRVRLDAELAPHALIPALARISTNRPNFAFRVLLGRAVS